SAMTASSGRIAASSAATRALSSGEVETMPELSLSKMLIAGGAKLVGRVADGQARGVRAGARGRGADARERSCQRGAPARLEGALVAARREREDQLEVLAVVESVIQGRLAEIGSA